MTEGSLWHSLEDPFLTTPSGELNTRQVSFSASAQPTPCGHMLEGDVHIQIGERWPPLSTCLKEHFSVGFPHFPYQRRVHFWGGFAESVMPKCECHTQFLGCGLFSQGVIDRGTQQHVPIGDCSRHFSSKLQAFGSPNAIAPLSKKTCKATEGPHPDGRIWAYQSQTMDVFLSIPSLMVAAIGYQTMSVHSWPGLGWSTPSYLLELMLADAPRSEKDEHGERAVSAPPRRSDSKVGSPPWNLERS